MKKSVLSSVHLEVLAVNNSSIKLFFIQLIF